MLIDSFSKSYPDKQSLRVDTTEYCEITEYDKNATMTNLKIHRSGTSFYTYPAELVKGMPSTDSEIISFIKDKDCDGVSFLKNNEGTEELVLSELKSGFGTGTISDAFNQVIHSFLKMYLMLSTCDSFSLNDLRISFIVACKTFESKDQEAKVWKKINDCKTLKRGHFEDKFLGKLLVRPFVEVPMKAFHDIDVNSYSDEIKSKHIQMRLCLTSSPKDHSIEFTI